MSKQTIVVQKNHLLLIAGIVVIACVLGGFFWARAVGFVGPTVAPGDWDYDFTENILGANNADNEFDSSLVTASSTGSIIERFEYMNNIIKNLYNVYGRGWTASSSGDSSIELTQETCEDAGWYWFEDANGDGDYYDPEDGLCASSTWFGVADSWNGVDCSTNDDNSYIADYTCTGSFPNGTVDTYSGYYTSGSCIVDGRAYAQGRCALCDVDCVDGRRDLPAAGGYVPNEAGPDPGICEGPLTTEALKNWQGTRLPTFQDFFGFCGSYGEDDPGDELYHTGCDATTTIGVTGHQLGRTDECFDLVGGNYEWLSERHSNYSARVAGSYACSYVYGYGVSFDYRFRAVFRP